MDVKIVFIHGLGGVERFEPVDRLGERLELEVVRAIYRDVTDEAGWSDSVLEHVERQIPRGPHVLVGHSFGAALALHLQREDTLGMVLISPFLSLHLPVRLVVLSEIIRHGKYRFEGESAVELSREDFNRVMKIVEGAPRPSRPSLTILGSKDKVVDVAYVRTLFSRLEGKEHWLVELSGVGHNLVGREEDAVTAMEAFLQATGILR